jgi:RNA polymerase sigma-70 factor (ECF subfamily)
MPPKGNSADIPPDEPKDDSNTKLYLELRTELLNQLLARYPQLAEDAVQETYLAVTTTRVRLEDQKDPRAYLFRIAINKVRELASQPRWSRHDVKELERLAKNPAATHGDISEAATTVGDVEKAFAELTELQQRVYELKEQHGLPTWKIATLLNISHRQAQRALTEARRVLKASLAHTTQGRSK